MTAGPRTHRAALAALLGGTALLLAAPPARALDFFSLGKAKADAAAAAGESHPNALQQPSEPLPGQDVNALGQPTYGVDVSFPIHHAEISDNYAWLPHNVDPANNPTPPQYAGKPIQYLGAKRDWYESFIKVI